MLTHAPTQQQPHLPLDRTPSQVADRLASYGLWVLMPELLGPDEAWPRDQFPPQSVWKNRLQDWLRKGAGSWGAQREKVAAVLNAAAAEAAAAGGGGGDGGGTEPRVGVAGVGWGALMATWAGTEGAFSPPAPSAGGAGGDGDGDAGGGDAAAPAAPSPLAPAPAAVAALSPQLHKQDDKLADALTSPLVMLASKYDNMDRLQVVLSVRKELYSRCEFRRFGMCYPGLFSWEPWFTDYEVDPKPGDKEARARLRAVAQASDMVEEVARFLLKHLTGAAEEGAAEEEAGGEEAGGGGESGAAAEAAEAEEEAATGGA